MSLVPFFTQERNCQRGRHEPTKTRLFLKLRLEAECKDNVLNSAPNDSLPKPETFLWAYAAHSRGSFSRKRKGAKSVSKGIPLRYPLGADDG